MFTINNILYLTDSYLKEFEAVIEDVKNGRHIILSQTSFYPYSGGQPYDTGMIAKGNERYPVKFVVKSEGKICHEVDKEGLKVGDKVRCAIDWNRRYQLMKSHTSAHLISEVIHRETKALITGNQLDIDKCRIDFALEDYHPEKMKEYIDEVNQIIKQDLKVSISFLSREEAMKLSQVSKLAKGLPPELKTLRIVNIGDFDVQADGGTHVNSTKEIENIGFIRCENKGKNNRRLYFLVK